MVIRGKGEMDLFLESFQKLRKKVLALCFGSVRNPVQTHIKEGQSYLLMASQVPGTALGALHYYLTICWVCALGPEAQRV